MTVLPVERPGPMHSPFHPDLDAADHLSLDANELWLAAQPASASQARDFTRAQLRTWGLEELTDLCVLVVSEMTTNAIKATATPSIPYGYARPPADHPHTSDHPPGRARARTAGPYPILLRLRLTTGACSRRSGTAVTARPRSPRRGRTTRAAGVCGSSACAPTSGATTRHRTGERSSSAAGHCRPPGTPRPWRPRGCTRTPPGGARRAGDPRPPSHADLGAGNGEPLTYVGRTRGTPSAPRPCPATGGAAPAPPAGSIRPGGVGRGAPRRPAPRRPV